MKSIIAIISFLFLTKAVSGQGESCNWLFGDNIGITFISGEPEDLNYSAPHIEEGPTTVVSDSAGNLLFYADAFSVYNRNFEVMDNGAGILGGRMGPSCIAFKKPGSQRYYYLFTVGDSPNMTYPINWGGRYSVIDLQANGGLGGIIAKNVILDQADDAMISVTATYHKNNYDIWLIMECQDYDYLYYNVYLINNSGIFLQHVYEQMKYLTGYQMNLNYSTLKVSPDGTKVLRIGDYLGVGIVGFMYSFDNETGNIFFDHGISWPAIHDIWGAEFSPSSQYLYLCGPGLPNDKIMQFDATITDSVEFENSMLVVGDYKATSSTVLREMQSGPDGKIYGIRSDDTLFCINKPDLHGLACETEEKVYKTNGTMNGHLPQFLTSYAQRFLFTGQCARQPFQFTSNFFPVPESILWDFGDGSTSTGLNPQHIYQDGGIYQVHVSVVFPGGRPGEATREVTVSMLPHPYTAGDTTICKGANLNLTALPGFTSYLWNTFSTTQSITVADTGYYWVEVINTEGCIGRDTVHVAWFAELQLVTVPVVSPTTCGSSIGAISGVTITGGSPPYSVRWVNSNGDTIGTSNNLYNLGVDNYYLWVTDQHGCQVQLFTCSIQNYDSDLIITNVPKIDTWCNQPLGSLDIEVQTGLSDRLFYSIEDWATWQTNGEFNNLLPGSYFVKVKDSLGCEAVFGSNPVIISSQRGLTVTDVNIIHETDNDADGTITITATGDALSFSIEGSPPQPDGLFTGLVQGQYTITVTDIHGCDSTFSVEVDRITAQTLFATAGDTVVCNGLRASEPLLVSNFKEITSFEITLNYNNLLLDVIGYINAHDDLIAGLEPVNYPSAGIIKLKWTGTGPVTLPDNTVMLDLVMQAKSVGLSTVDWVLASNETNFVNQYGVAVQVIPETGNVEVAPTPGIMGIYQENVCEFGTLSQMAIPIGGTGTSTITWDTPHGTATGPEYRIDAARPDDSGLYRIKVVDQMNCVATDSVEVTVIPLPVNNFPTINDTIHFEQHFTLEATPGYFSYEWNTGDTTYFITGTEEGSYSVIIQTQEGCTTVDSAYLKNVNMPFSFNVPNAFTPNGDGLNDTFRPVTDYDLFSKYNIVIYNSWGQRIFETTNPAEGWNGKNAAAGVYVWVINYADYLGKVATLRGSVSLVK